MGQQLSDQTHLTRRRRLSLKDIASARHGGNVAHAVVIEKSRAGVGFWGGGGGLECGGGRGEKWERGWQMKENS